MEDAQLRRRVPAELRKQRDAGLNLIELVIAVFLLGTVGVFVLSAVRSSVQASAVARERAEAIGVLQSVSNLVAHKVDFEDCDTASEVKDEYHEALQDAMEQSTVQMPKGWQVAVADVQFATGQTEYGASCDENQHRHLLTLQVAGTYDGKPQQLDVIKVKAVAS